LGTGGVRSSVGLIRTGKEKVVKWDGPQKVGLLGGYVAGSQGMWVKLKFYEASRSGGGGKLLKNKATETVVMMGDLGGGPGGENSQHKKPNPKKKNKTKKKMMGGGKGALINFFVVSRKQ